MDYAKLIHRRCVLHFNLAENIRNKIVQHNIGLLLLMHIYGSSKYLCEGIKGEVVSLRSGSYLIIDAVCKRQQVYVFPLLYTRNVSICFQEHEMTMRITITNGIAFWHMFPSSLQLNCLLSCLNP